MRKYLAHMLAQTLPFDDRIVDLIKDTALILSTPDKGWRGAAVLIAPRTALTVTQNLEDAAQVTITRPASGEHSGLTKVTSYDRQGLVILELRGSSLAPYAEVSHMNDPKPDTPVAMPCLFGHAGESPVQNATDITLVKGVVMESGSKEDTLSSLFHLRSGGFDSGAGIFNQNGRILTLRRGGDNRYEAQGIPLAAFRTILK